MTAKNKTKKEEETKEFGEFEVLKYFILTMFVLFFPFVLFAYTPTEIDKNHYQTEFDQAILEESFTKEEAELLKTFASSDHTEIEEAVKQVKAIRKYTESKNK
jgi:hypothetical protein